MPLDLVVNVLVSGLLTGLVYGLMALGLSVIYGVVRIVNFAHGELMALAMYVAVVAFAALGLDPLWMLLPVARRSSCSATRCSGALINPFIDRPEHSQFMLLLALALVLVNGLLLAFGPDARNVQVEYALDSYRARPAARRQGARDLRRRRAGVLRAAVRDLSLHAVRQGDPRLRRQPARRAASSAWTSSTSTG